jgi:hypothetical protein
MRNRCLDEGLLQAYIDGELSQGHAAEAAAHIASCGACAAALAEAAGENNFFAAAFAPDDSLSVPSQILRSRIGAAVAQLEDSPASNRKRSGGFNFDGFLTSLSSLFTFTPQRAAAFASLLVLVAAGVIYFAVIRPHGTKDAPQGPQEIARGGTTPEHREVTPPTPNASNNGVTESGDVPVTTTVQGNASPRFVNAGYTPRRRVSRPEAAQPTPAPAETAAAKKEVLPGEKAYQTAIASLEKTIKFGGDASLKPSVRVQYERNLAILDSAIEQTRKVASTNPKDKDAVGFLMSAYQSKVELLTKVADQAQVAALGR